MEKFPVGDEHGESKDDFEKFKVSKIMDGEDGTNTEGDSSLNHRGKLRSIPEESSQKSLGSETDSKDRSNQFLPPQPPSQDGTRRTMSPRVAYSTSTLPVPTPAQRDDSHVGGRGREMGRTLSYPHRLSPKTAANKPILDKGVSVPHLGHNMKIERFSEIANSDIQPDSDSAADKALQIAARSFVLNRKQTMGNDSVVSEVSPPKRGADDREIQQDHAQYALTYGMMLGIRVTTGRLALSQEENVDRDLEEPDFDTVTRLVFPPEGSQESATHPTPPHKLNHTFKFKDYAPLAFRMIRRLSGIDEADYVLSLAGDFNYIEFLANSKSGQYFFYSHCGKYMIKTQTKRECRVLRKMLPDYIKHLNVHPNSLLVRFYGMHRVKMSFVEPKGKIYFIVMSSVFDTSLNIHLKYDLKGSTVGRITSEKDCERGHVQKDLNLINSGRVLYFGAYVKDFRTTLETDSAFLAAQNVMDYSLLVGVHDGASSRMGHKHKSVVLSGPRATATTEEDSGAAVSPSIWRGHYNGFRSARMGSKEIYFLGIIDILQTYNMKKRVENIMRGFKGEDRSKISAVHPLLYAERFTNFLMGHTDENKPLALRSPHNSSAATQEPLPESSNGGAATNGDSASNRAYLQIGGRSFAESMLSEEDGPVSPAMSSLTASFNTHNTPMKDGKNSNSLSGKGSNQSSSG